MEEGYGEHAYDRMVLFLCSKLFMRTPTGLTKAGIRDCVKAAPLLHRAPGLWEACSRDVKDLLKWAKKNGHKKRKVGELSQTTLNEFFGK